MYYIFKIVVFLLQATAICGVLVYDLSEGYKNDGWKPMDSVFTSLIVLIGGSLASGGSMAINMWYERDIDPLMERTETRPIPSGFISPSHALTFGITVCLHKQQFCFAPQKIKKKRKNAVLKSHFFFI